MCKAGKIVDFESLDAEVQDLIKQGASVRENAYAPYSKFKVGSAILCSDGKIFKGCNVENVSYPVGICAERGAIAKAVSEGYKRFKILIVIADELEGGNLTTPCGMCRQAIVEFGNIPIYCANSDMKKVLQTTINDLLPYAFSQNEMKN
ncbi:hypothetical protein M0802_007792 [Mischocyttarus mexicanus]|nr:hypothetical protein M0802_007792 [Mischocyttarus mexicanus]